MDQPLHEIPKESYSAEPNPCTRLRNHMYAFEGKLSRPLPSDWWLVQPPSHSPATSHRPQRSFGYLALVNDAQFW